MPRNDDMRMIPRSEDELERTLAELGPLMAEQEAVEAEMDSMFAARLRAHLLDSRELAPHPTFARNLRARLLPSRGARPLRNPDAIPWRRWAGVSAFASAVAVALLLFAALRPSGSVTNTITVPHPTKADLTFSFPSLPHVLHRITATLSLVHSAPGIAFAGHLHLAATTFPKLAARLPAYRLTRSTVIVYSGRTLLDVHAPVRRVTVQGEAWLVAADGGSAHHPLHSLAVSTKNGEVIYHDRRNRLLPRTTHPISRTRAIAAGRAWLTTLGWQGDLMPLRRVTDVTGHPNVRAVVFGWPQTAPAATEEATLWVTPDGSVIEAWVWPAIAQRGSVTVRPVTNAWNDVRRGLSPLAVVGLSPRATATGVGKVLGTEVVSVLSPGRSGTMYLVPAYRFSGTAHILGSHPWYSLVPSESP